MLRAITAQRVGQPRPAHLGEQRIPRELHIHLRADETDQPQAGTPDGMAVRVVQQDQPPGGEGPAGSGGEFQTPGVTPRRQPARSRYWLKANLGSGPHATQGDHSIAKDFRGVRQIRHIGNCRKTVSRSPAETPLASRREPPCPAAGRNPCNDGGEMSKTTATGSVRRLLPDAPLLLAARGKRPPHPPVWFMRQAGRSLPEYRQLRADVSMLQACLTPELACEITLQPVRRHGVDAAILFSDIMVPLHAAGVELEIVPGIGPVLGNPVRSTADVMALPALEPDAVEPVAAAVRLLVAELHHTPLIGFAGAPFTLASYLVEGGPSRHHEQTRALMHSQPQVWHALLERLTEITLTFLRVQVAAGVDAVQLFDSWAGVLSERDYREFVLPYSARILGGLASAGVPRIHFGVGTGELLAAMAQAGPDVLGVDWRIPLDEAARRVRAARPGSPVVLQGNLDPAVLLAGWPVVEREVRRVLAEGRAADAHVLNLGHGVLPDTDPGVLTRVVDLVHTL
jgi:uroporphyrinogen decarboxylase